METVTFDRTKDGRGIVQHTLQNHLAEAIEAIRRGRVPRFLGSDIIVEDNWTYYPRDMYKVTDVRREMTSAGMWAAIDMTWTKRLADWIGDRVVLEVMAGRGWLAKALTLHGLTVFATDDHSWDAKHSRAAIGFPIIEIDAVEAVERFEADVLIISWPPYGCDKILHVMNTWGTERPVVYIGEFGGCNAPEEFSTFFDLIDDLRFGMPHHDMIHDDVFAGYWNHIIDVDKAVKRRNAKSELMSEGLWDWNNDRPDKGHITALWIEEVDE